MSMAIYIYHSKLSVITSGYHWRPNACQARMEPQISRRFTEQPGWYVFFGKSPRRFGAEFSCGVLSGGSARVEISSEIWGFWAPKAVEIIIFLMKKNLRVKCPQRMMRKRRIFLVWSLRRWRSGSGKSGSVHSGCQWYIQTWPSQALKCAVRSTTEKNPSRHGCVAHHFLSRDSRLRSRWMLGKLSAITKTVPVPSRKLWAARWPQFKIVEETIPSTYLCGTT